MTTSTLTPSFRGAKALTKSDLDAGDTAPGAGLICICSGAGNVKFKTVDGSTPTYPIAVGLTILPFQVVRVFTTGTTATATFENGF